MALKRKFNALLLLGVVPAALVACPVDERTLEPYPVEIIGPGGGGESGAWWESSGTGASAGEPSGSSGQGSGGTGLGGSGGASASGRGGNAGNLGTAGEADAGEPACPDLDADGEPDCTQTLVDNGRFDSDTMGWVFQDSVERSWQPVDATGRSDSGALELTNALTDDSSGIVMAGAYQCIPIRTNQPTNYTLIGQVYIEPGQGEGSAGVSMIFFSLPGCEGSMIGHAEQTQADTGGWQIAYTNDTTTFETKSVAVRLVVAKPFQSERFVARFDNVLFVND